MAKVLIYVEGLTEQAFTRRVLAPHLATHGVFAVPKIATTKTVEDGPDFKGGVTDYGATRRQLLSLLGDTSAAMVTTLIDYYGLPSGFPGRNSLPQGSCHDRVAHLEEELGKDIGHRRFLPHLQLHEFEAMLLSAPEELTRVLGNGEREATLAAICGRCASPEEIDDDPAGAPSKRLQALFPEYQKALHGPLVARRIGLERIRSECRHFDQWLSFLERVPPA